MNNMSSTKQREFWDKAAQSDNLRNEWICDKNVTDEQCLNNILPFLKKGKTLDLGCGIGRLTQGYGVDISQQMLNRAKPGNEYKLCDGETIPYPDDYFENVFSLAMFQHIPDTTKKNYIEEAYRVLKPDGNFRLQFVTESEEGPFNKPVAVEVVMKWCKDVGFEDIIVQEGVIFKEWAWIWATK